MSRVSLKAVTVLVSSILFLWAGTAWAQLADDEEDQEGQEAPAELQGEGESKEELGEGEGAPSLDSHPAIKAKKAKKPKKAKKKPKKDYKKDPETVAALEALIEAHIEHTNAADLDAYVGDFLPEHPAKDKIRSYALRVFEESPPEVEVEELEIVAASRTSARVRVVQRAYYEVEDREVETLTEVTYRVRVIKGQGWKIDGTSRRRLFEDAED